MCVFSGLRSRGIGVQVHYVPLYAHSSLSDIASGGPASFPNTEAAYSQLISLPLFPGLSDTEQELVVDALDKELAK